MKQRPILLMHVFGFTTNELPHLFDDPNCTRGALKKPELDGYYYEFNQSSEDHNNFKIIYHAAISPYHAEEGCIYGGPINPHKLIELIAAQLFPFVGVLTSKPVAVKIEDLSDEEAEAVKDQASSVHLNLSVH